MARAPEALTARAAAAIALAAARPAPARGALDGGETANPLFH
jgi:hypothetical protein